MLTGSAVLITVSSALSGGVLVLVTVRVVPQTAPACLQVRYTRDPFNLVSGTRPRLDLLPHQDYQNCLK
jgi:hypothetical protein